VSKLVDIPSQYSWRQLGWCVHHWNKKKYLCLVSPCRCWVSIGGWHLCITIVIRVGNRKNQRVIHLLVASLFASHSHTSYRHSGFGCPPGPVQCFPEHLVIPEGPFRGARENSLSYDKIRCVCNEGIIPFHALVEGCPTHSIVSVPCGLSYIVYTYRKY